MIDLPKVFVVPAEGVRIPLPIAGMRIAAVGAEVRRDTHIERLLRTGDLLEGDAATKLAAMRQAVLDKAAKDLAEKEAAEAAKNAPAAAEEIKSPAMSAPAAEAKPQPSAAKAEK